MAATFCSLLVTPFASAINITMDFNSGASDSPTYDSNRQGLINLFDYAEAFYEDVFEDTHDITINFWYVELDGARLGNCELVRASNGRVNEANIRIDVNQTWFIDPTPSDSSEFAMQQTLWRDISDETRSDFYNDFDDDIPQTFEVGFRGAALDAGPADNRNDMLTTVLHEVGHALGMLGINGGELADNDYDFDPAFIFGQSLAAVNVGPSSGHLENTWALMNPGILEGSRTLPGHTDLFAMATGHNYTVLDVPRREFYGGSHWNADANWSGNQVPGSTDDVFLRHEANVSLTAAGVSRELNVVDATLNLGAHNFTASGDITVDIGGRMIFDGGTLLCGTDVRLKIGRYKVGRFDHESGTVRLFNNLTLGEGSGSDGVYELDTGTLSVGNNSPIEVGRSGQGQLVQNGGTINAPFMYVGRLTGSQGVFRNLGGLTQIQRAIDVGGEGRGEMRIQSGSLVSNNNGTIGVENNSTGIVTVTGSDARWTNSGFLKVGEFGSGTLNVFFGGSVSNTFGYIGYSSGSNGTATVTGNGSAWTNSDDLTVGDNGRGELVISAGGRVFNIFGFVGANPTANGEVTVTGPGSEWQNAASLYIGGSDEPGGVGKLNINDGGTVSVEEDLTIWPTGTVNLSGGRLATTRLVISGGTFNMTGGRLRANTVIGNLTVAGGTLAPFESGTFVDGNYAQGSGATLEIEIAGNTNPSYDRLYVDGSASLNGQLQISLFDGFVPAAADSFLVMETLGGILGSFANAANGSRLQTTDGLGSFLVHYGAGSIFNPAQVILTSFQLASLTGDYNSNNVIDAGDYLVWRSTFGSSEDLRADGNNNLVIDAADYVIWRNAFSAGTAASSQQIALVPEPTTLLLLFCALACAPLRQRRGQQL